MLLQINEQITLGISQLEIQVTNELASINRKQILYH
jgi:hypothetical protein